MGARLDESARQFRKRWQGKYIWNNGTLGPNAPIVGGRPQAQCVSLSNEAVVELHGALSSTGNACTDGPHGAGIDYSAQGATWIPNGAENHPDAGDIVKFLGGPYDPTYGHTGMALHGCSATHLHILWQNDPDFSPVSNNWIGYAACLGWWHWPGDKA